MRVAMPLDQVSWLDEFEEGQIERTGSQEVVQYRGRMVPLVRIGGLLGEVSCSVRLGRLPLIVCRYLGHSIGFVVGRIIDIAQVQPTQLHPPTRAGVLGSQILNERVTEHLDVVCAMESAMPGLKKESEQTGERK